MLALVGPNDVTAALSEIGVILLLFAVATTLIAPPLLALLFAGETCDPAVPDCEVVDADEPLASID